MPLFEAYRKAFRERGRAYDDLETLRAQAARTGQPVNLSAAESAEERARARVKALEDRILSTPPRMLAGLGVLAAMLRTVVEEPDTGEGRILAATVRGVEALGVAVPAGHGLPGGAP